MGGLSMKTCPVCKETNGNDNTKCFKCGADLPVVRTESVHSFKGQTSSQHTTNNNSEISNADRISSMSVAVCIVGLILAVILGFVFQVETVTSGLYSTHTEYSFNWVLCISTAIGTVCFSIILKAMSYITKAIEEK